MSYTYLIGWVELDKWYYGSRFAKNSKPDDLWKTYFTSSKFVKAMTAKHGDPDVIEIRRVFDEREKAIEWERKVIRRMGLIMNKRWLNLANGGSNMAAEERSIRTRNNMSKSQRKGVLQKYGFEDYEEYRYFILYCLNDGMTPNKIRIVYGINGWMLDEIIKTVDGSFLKKCFKTAFKGKLKTMEHRQNISKGRKGIIFSEEHKENLKQSKSKSLDKRIRTRLDNEWKRKGFDSHDDAVRIIQSMYNEGIPMYKIAEKLKIDPITVSKKVKL